LGVSEGSGDGDSDASGDASSDGWCAVTQAETQSPMPWVSVRAALALQATTSWRTCWPKSSSVVAARATIAPAPTVARVATVATAVFQDSEIESNADSSSLVWGPHAKKRRAPTDHPSRGLSGQRQVAEPGQRRRGSSASRSPSPTRLKARTAPK